MPEQTTEMDTEIDIHADSPSDTPVVAIAPSDLIERPTLPSIDSSDTPKQDQRDHTRCSSRNEKPTLRRIDPDEIRDIASFYSSKGIEKLKKYGVPDGLWRTRINVPHVQETQESTNLQCVPKRLHDTRTGQVRATSGMGGAFEYVTVSHVWDMTDGVDWSNLSRRIGEELSVPYVWVDKTCINQTDEEEKGEEIKKMAEYYSSAKHNAIIVSDFSMAAAVHAWKDEGMVNCTPAHAHAVKSVRDLMRHRYFARVWTMQEQELARHNVLLMEDGWVYGHDLDNLLRSLTDMLIHPDKSSIDGDIEYMFCNCQRRKNLTSRQWQMSLREPLIEVWRRARGRTCTNPKDVVWGMISLVEGGDKIKATYDDDLSDVLAELLELENRLGEILLITDWMNGSQDDHNIPLWQLRATGLVPMIVSRFPRLENAQNVHFTREGRFLGANAYLFEQWNGDDRYNPILGGEQLFGDPLHGFLWRPHNRLWFVPIWRNETFTRGVVLLDWNSEGNKIHKVRTLDTSKVSTKALARATATSVWIGGT